MTDLKPDLDVQKILISSPSPFCGAYESNRVLITPAWPTRQKNLKIKHTPYGCTHFVVAFKDEIYRQNDKPRITKDYAYLWDTICIYLSILFGKRFDDHGFLEYYGLYSVPNFHEAPQICYTKIGPYNREPRKDLGIPLNLTEVKRIERLFYNDSLDQRFLRFLYTAGKFYLRSLRIFEEEPELAFIDLVNCGEVLANYYDYSEDDLYDEEIKGLLKEIETACSDGAKKARMIRERLYQVRKKYALTIMKLLNDYFFTNSEVEEGWEVYSLKQEDIEKRIKASYDLRSKYLHTGAQFGENLRPARSLNEIPIVAGPPVDATDFIIGKKDAPEFKTEFAKAYVLSPTFIGLERIMRFCLLRFIHKHGIRIDESLGDNQ